MAATRRTTTTKAKKPLKGRAMVAIGLALFFVATTANVTRRIQGINTERALARMRQEQRTLLAQEKFFENELRRATSRRTVVQEAQKRLGMIRPGEAQVRFLAVPTAGAVATPPDSVEQP